MPDSKALSVSATARRLGVTPPTVKKLIDSGKLRAYAIYAGKRKQLRVPVEFLEEYLAKAERIARGYESPDQKVTYL